MKLTQHGDFESVAVLLLSRRAAFVYEIDVH